ncbi:hypothetical protein [Bradyrhizobium sp. STM 3809]|uniref:hypothetical protein n=1 Tax=Bradyrhizobium sp. STM 3809 TaxID=551936 RepID=UPI0014797195|nr:hypothetical protein [Bradyrhizobium sp. STM 3809]
MQIATAMIKAPGMYAPDFDVLCTAALNAPSAWAVQWTRPFIDHSSGMWERIASTDAPSADVD